jgi:hypothetical protein
MAVGGYAADTAPGEPVEVAAVLPLVDLKVGVEGQDVGRDRALELYCHLGAPSVGEPKRPPVAAILRTILRPVSSSGRVQA